MFYGTFFSFDIEKDFSFTLHHKCFMPLHFTALDVHNILKEPKWQAKEQLFLATQSHLQAGATNNSFHIYCFW